jgi:hypothetical protein
LVVELSEFGGGDRSAPGEAFGDCGLEVVEVALMQGGCFAGLDRRKDGHGIGPERCIEGGEGCLAGLEAGLPEMKCGEDVGIAIVEEGRVGCRDAELVDGGGGSEGEIEESVPEQWTIDEISIEPADGIEGGCEVVTTAPHFGCV